MNDIQKARDVLAKWREDTTPLPWDHSNETEGEVVHTYEARSAGMPRPTETAAQTFDMNDARLIVGTAGNPDLLDAIDELLALEAAVEKRGGPVFANTQRIAAAIVAADERMSA